RPSACPYTTLFRSYKKMENTEINPAMKFKFTKTNVPAIPINTLKTNACPVVILPAGNGRSIVRSINLSKSFSMISLNPFAAPVTRKPPTVSNAQLNQIISPCCVAPINNEIDAEKTTVRVSLNLTSLLKSEINSFIIKINPKPSYGLKHLALAYSRVALNNIVPQRTKSLLRDALFVQRQEHETSLK